MNHVKPRNGPISPRERDMNNSGYSNHQPPHYNNYSNSTQNNSSPSSQQPQPQQPNSDLINFVSGAWKEKVSVDDIDDSRSWVGSLTNHVFSFVDERGSLQVRKHRKAQSLRLGWLASNETTLSCCKPRPRTPQHGFLVTAIYHHHNDTTERNFFLIWKSCFRVSSELNLDKFFFSLSDSFSFVFFITFPTVHVPHKHTHTHFSFLIIILSLFFSPSIL